MRVLITGSGGQVGRHLRTTKPAGADVLWLTHAECDITVPSAINAAVETFRPDAIINAAAFTNVDRAESETETAFAVNRDGAANVAQAAARSKAFLIHISTDYVFDGSQTTPYATTAQPAPLGAYGASKLAGEERVVASGASATIVRTAWLFSESGQNFVGTVIRLLNSGGPVRVVSDQIGTPTSAQDLADVLWQFVQRPPQHRILHWTNSGVASRYDIANAVRELATDRGIVEGGREITPVTSSDFPARARRPGYSVLDSSVAWQAFGTPRHWRLALADTLDKIVTSAENP